MPLSPIATLRLSAQTGDGLQALEDQLGAHLLAGDAPHAANAAMLTRLHQQDSLRRAQDRVLHLLQDTALSPEFHALDLRQALQALGEITGETTPEDILDTIFSQFCVGK
jgi:tRNA modification GTPase